MKYTETGFRAVYQHFCAFEMNDTVRKAVASYPGVETANYILGYGYIDHDAGLTLEVLATAEKFKNGFKFFEANMEIRVILRIDSLQNEEFYIFEDKDGEIAKRYADRLAILREYSVSDEIEKTREMGFLDGSRHEHYPDDIMVFLIRDGLSPEGCWARITGIGEHCFIATLLNEPNQSFGYHKGDTISFFVNQGDDGKITCYADMNPSEKLKQEDLEGGLLLREAITKFNAERTEQNLISVLEILRDSYLWIPCNTIMSDADQKRMEEAIAGMNGDLEQLIGMEFSNVDPVRMVPDILQNGDKFFFPAFASEEDMGEYGEGFSKVEKHMLEIIQLAINNESNVSGIVVNAFSEPFVLNRELFDLIQKMKSRVIE